MPADKILVQAPGGIPPRLLAEYIERCFVALPAVKQALDQSDYRETGVFGHRLRGTGDAYGVPLLTEIGSRIEDASSRADTAELRRQVTALEDYLEQLEIVFSRTSSRE